MDERICTVLIFNQLQKDWPTCQAFVQHGIPSNRTFENFKTKKFRNIESENDVMEKLLNFILFLNTRHAEHNTWVARDTMEAGWLSVIAYETPQSNYIME